MIDRIIAWSLAHRAVTLTLTLVLALAGLRAAFQTPLDVIPDLSERQVLVHAAWAGRSPREVEERVTRVLTSAIQSVPGARAVRGMSGPGFAMVDVMFDDDVGRDEARAAVAERLAAVQTELPRDVVATLGPDATALGHVLWYTVEGGGLDPVALRTVQDQTVRRALQSVPGVAEVASVGGAAAEWHVELDPVLLDTLGVTAEDVAAAVARTDAAGVGGAVESGGASHALRARGALRSGAEIEDAAVVLRDGVPVRVADLARVRRGPGPRQAFLERDGREAVGGVVVLRSGEHPLAVVDAVHRRIRELGPSLPSGVRIVPFYDRGPLVRAALRQSFGTLAEEALIASGVILVVMLHAGASVVVCLTLPLSVLGCFALMRAAGIPANVMSLAGIAVSVGVLADQAIVLTDNAMHRLREEFGDRHVSGDVASLLVRPCQEVGRPVFFAVLILVVSFVPVLALGGIEGRMFHPFAWTKTLVLLAAGALTITFVPAVLPLVLRGRMRSEDDSWLVRSVATVYRPVLAWLLDRPRVIIVAFAAILAAGWIVAGGLGREFLPPLDEGSILDMPVTAPGVSVTQAGNDLRARNEFLRSYPEVETVAGKAGRAETATDPSPLEMVETVIDLRPRDSWPRRHLDPGDARAQSQRVVAALRARGLVPTADASATDALVERLVRDATDALDADLRGVARAHQLAGDAAVATALARRTVDEVSDLLARSGRLSSEPGAEERARVGRTVEEHVGAFLAAGPLLADVESGAACAARELLRGKAELDPAVLAEPESAAPAMLRDALAVFTGDAPDVVERLHGGLVAERHRLHAETADRLRQELERSAPETFTRAAVRSALAASGGSADVADPQVVAVVGDLATPWRPFLAPKSKADLVEELDRTLRVPGWANIWTQPIVNRIDMLTTGIRTRVGARVLGPDQAVTAEVAQRVAAVVRDVPGAADVTADDGVSRSYLDVSVDRERAARHGLGTADVLGAVDLAIAGRVVAEASEGGDSVAVRVRYARSDLDPVERVGRVLVPAHAASEGDAGTPSPAASGASGGGRSARSAHGSAHGAPTRRGPPTIDASASASVPSGANPPVHVQVRDVASATMAEGPSMIRSEAGAPCSYVQMNVRGRDPVGFVEEARSRVASGVVLPPGVRVEWGGDFEHEARARRTLLLVVPASVVLIFLVLWLTFHDGAHAALVLLAVPGALAGGVLAQAILGYDLSVASWVGHVACFGMATQTGIVMLVYLRGAVDRAGGLAAIGSVERLREVVLDGAVRRLRPKLLTEATTLLAIAPMIWATGAGSEVTAPMAAPVLGGILIADEVVDLLLPVLFFRVERGRWLGRGQREDAHGNA